MRKAAVYVAQDGAAAHKAARVYAQLGAAFATVAELERHCVGGAAGTALDRPMPGLMQVRSRTPIIALGRRAHTALSHVIKRTLIVEDLEDPSDPDAACEIEHLVWSCVNTSKIVALGERAWQSVQLLPIADRRFYNVPPLRMTPLSGKVSRHSVLVINHDTDDARARALAEVLERADMQVRRIGFADPASNVPADARWSDDALIHVHVGDHTLEAEEPRLVDSWHSQRLTLQLAAGIPRSNAHSHNLAIEDEANGFICESPHEIITVCRDLLEDRVLQRKVIAAGQSSVGPLVKTWEAVAEDLLA